MLLLDGDRFVSTCSLLYFLWGRGQSCSLLLSLLFSPLPIITLFCFYCLHSVCVYVCVYFGTRFLTVFVAAYLLLLWTYILSLHCFHGLEWQGVLLKLRLLANFCKRKSSVQCVLLKSIHLNWKCSTVKTITQAWWALLRWLYTTREFLLLSVWNLDMCTGFT